MFSLGFCIKSGCSPMGTGVSSYLFDSAVFFLVRWPGVARRRLSLLLLRQKKVSKEKATLLSAQPKGLGIGSDSDSGTCSFPLWGKAGMGASGGKTPAARLFKAARKPLPT
jgi:hypothetical protein